MDDGGSFSSNIQQRCGEPPLLAVLSNIPRIPQHALQKVDGSTQEYRLVVFIHSSPPNARRHPKCSSAAAVSAHIPSVSPGFYGRSLSQVFVLHREPRLLRRV